MISNRRLTGLLFGSILVAALSAACGAGSSGADADGSGGSEKNTASGGSTQGGAGGGIGGTSGGLGGEILPGQGGAANHTLIIDPTDPVIETDGTPKALQLVANVDGTKIPSAVWLTDDVNIGTISDQGLFTAKGMLAGTVKVTARYGELEGTTTITVKVSMEQNPAGISDEDKLLLRTGGSADSTFRWLYPYNKTVFPRGLAAPLLQLGGGATSSVRVTLDGGDFHYEGFFAGSSPLRITLPEDVWAGATASTGSGAELTVGVTKLSGGEATGPNTQSLFIAQGKLKGSIYYNSYNSKLAGGGAILRVKAGHDAEVVQGGCTVCHSVSAHGNRIATGLSWSETETITGTGNPIKSGTIDIAPDGTATPLWTDPDGRRFSFAALTPDGVLALTSAVAPENQIRGLSGVNTSGLFDAATGVAISAPSFTTQVKYAVTPQFSPDASSLAFSWYRDENAQNSHILATMSFDGSQSPPVFGVPEIITQSTKVVGWPSFTPDAQAVLFHEGDAFDTEKRGGKDNHSDIRLVELATKTVIPLDALNGYENGVTYLPYGDEEEGHLNYEPTVFPLPVGGYYWVVFTSRRAYGNAIAPGGSDSTDKFLQNSSRKKLWVAAIDLTGTPGADRSHPAFYLPGQEIASGNMRGFAAFDPCKPDGDTCESGADCCGGFCRQTGTDGEGNPVLACVPPPAGCSNEDETCTTTADCCGAAQGYVCINGRCAQPGVN
jgi:hypothetical protein